MSTVNVIPDVIADDVRDDSVTWSVSCQQAFSVRMTNLAHEQRTTECKMSVEL